MRAALFSILLAVCAITAPVAAKEVKPTVYRTAKAMEPLEKCLTENLATRGDVTAINEKGMITLLLRSEGQPPMLIDLAPPKVTVTTRLSYGTRGLIEKCL
jgi:hypothetical protein